MDSVGEAVDYELDWIVVPSTGSKHYRLQPNLTDVSNEMDDASPQNMDKLRALAEKYLKENDWLINEICAMLKVGRGSAMPGIGLAVQPTTDSGAKTP